MKKLLTDYWIFILGCAAFVVALIDSLVRVDEFSVDSFSKLSIIGKTGAIIMMAVLFTFVVKAIWSFLIQLRK